MTTEPTESLTERPKYGTKEKFVAALCEYIGEGKNGSRALIEGFVTDAIGRKWIGSIETTQGNAYLLDAVPSIAMAYQLVQMGAGAQFVEHCAADPRAPMALILELSFAVEAAAIAAQEDAEDE